MESGGHREKYSRRCRKFSSGCQRVPTILTRSGLCIDVYWKATQNIRASSAQIYVGSPMPQLARCRVDLVAIVNAAVLTACLVLTAIGRPVYAQDKETLWDALRTGGAFALMRHALAPGTGDPPGFNLSDCATQRNLSDAGRRQAIEIGANFRAQGIARAWVYTSAWCRCRETAALLDLGPVEVLPSLNSFFADREQREPQTEALKAWLASADYDMPLVLVTHQVNITALTGSYTRSGEIVVAQMKPDGDIVVLGKL